MLYLNQRRNIFLSDKYVIVDGEEDFKRFLEEEVCKDASDYFDELLEEVKDEKEEVLAGKEMMENDIDGVLQMIYRKMDELDKEGAEEKVKKQEMHSFLKSLTEAILKFI